MKRKGSPSEHFTAKLATEVVGYAEGAVNWLNQEGHLLSVDGMYPLTIADFSSVLYIFVDRQFYLELAKDIRNAYSDSLLYNTAVQITNQYLNDGADPLRVLQLLAGRVEELGVYAQQLLPDSEQEESISLVEAFANFLVSKRGMSANGAALIIETLPKLQQTLRESVLSELQELRSGPSSNPQSN